MNCPRRAFTLVEMLIVIAVVGLLAAILFPVVSRVRASARTSTCNSNLRQIGQALILYTSDNDGFYPPCVIVDAPNNASSLWWMNLNLNPPPVCPDVDLEFRADCKDLRGWINGYAFNRALNKKSGLAADFRLSGRAEFVVPYPSLTVTAFDARPLLYGLREPDMLLTPKDIRRSARNNFFDNDILKLPPGATRHHGGANYLFGDGHVKWFRPEQLSTTRQNDGVHPGFGL